MANIPTRLARVGNVDADVVNSFVYSPTPVSVASAKITHIMDHLAAIDNGNGSPSTSAASSWTTIYGEKITHLTQKLSNAGLSDDSSNGSTSHGLGTKWIVVISVVCGVVFLAAVIGGCLLWRRYRKRRAYAVVSRGVDGNNEKGKEAERHSDVFNADVNEPDQEKVPFTDDGRMPFTDQPRLGERNFENGYDSIDTEYEGSRERSGPSNADGDKRAHYDEA